MDPHQVLGVPVGASTDEVRAAFRRHAARHHPDRGGDPEQFIAGQEAYDELMAARRPVTGALLQFHRRRRAAPTVRAAFTTAARRLARRPVPPPRVQ